MVRCLNLAKFLLLKEVDLFFISRNHFGNINYLIKKNRIKLYEFESLDAKDKNIIYEDNNYKQWLGCSELDDAKETIRILKLERPTMTIVDHYSLSSVWKNT